MKKTLASLLAVGAALVLAAVAQAKGPSAATVSGDGIPGGSASVDSGSPGDPRAGTRLHHLMEESGFIPAVFAQTPDPMLASRPDGDLGRRYDVTWRVPGPNGEVDTVRMEVYPYAKPSPVTYTPPGQRIFGTRETNGGWYRAPIELKTTLEALGVPASPPATEETRDWFSPAQPATLATAIVLLALVAGAFVLVRRRPGTTGTA